MTQLTVTPPALPSGIHRWSMSASMTPDGVLLLHDAFQQSQGREYETLILKNP
jgi:hypothetical protein